MKNIIYNNKKKKKKQNLSNSRYPNQEKKKGYSS